MMYIFLLKTSFVSPGYMLFLSRLLHTKNLKYTLQFCGTVISFFYLDFLLGGLSDVGISNRKLCLL